MDIVKSAKVESFFFHYCKIRGTSLKSNKVRLKKIDYKHHLIRVSERGKNSVKKENINKELISVRHIKYRTMFFVIKITIKRK